MARRKPFNFQFRILIDDDGADDAEVAQQGLAAIECVIHINQLWFERNNDKICALAKGLVKYDSKNKDVLSLIGEIKTAPVLIRTGIGLCIDIVAFDVAVRRFEGKKAWPVIIPRGGGVYHVVTETYDDSGNLVQLDPSLELEQMGLVVTGRPERCRNA